MGESPLQLDDHLKNLLRELGHAINDTVSESDRITGAIAGVRAHGYDIVLKLDATIGLAKRGEATAEDAKLTTQDRRFLESLRIQVDQESMAEETDKKPVAKLAMTPQRSEEHTSELQSLAYLVCRLLLEKKKKKKKQNKSK